MKKPCYFGLQFLCIRTGKANSSGTVAKRLKAFLNFLFCNFLSSSSSSSLIMNCLTKPVRFRFTTGTSMLELLLDFSGVFSPSIIRWSLIDAMQHSIMSAKASSSDRLKSLAVEVRCVVLFAILNKQVIQRRQAYGSKARAGMNECGLLPYLYSLICPELP